MSPKELTMSFPEDGTSSIITKICDHPAYYTELDENERVAVSHLIKAVDLLVETDSKDSPTLGALAPLKKMRASIKRYEKHQYEAKAKSITTPIPTPLKPTDPNHFMGKGRSDMPTGFEENFDFGGEMSEEDIKLIEHISSHFLKINKNPMKKKPDLKAIFRTMDDDGSGKLDYDELRLALSNLGLNLSDKEMELLVQKLDIDGDGSVNYMEFIRFVKIDGETKTGNEKSDTDKIEEALTHVSRGIFILAEEHHFFSMRAECYFRLHDLKSCVSNLRYVLKLIAGDGDTRKRLAIVLDLQGINWLKIGSFEVAGSCFAESCKLDPITSVYWVHKSVAFVYVSKYSDALRSVEQAMTVEKATVDVLCLRGKIHWALDLIDAGNRDFRQAQELDPVHPEVKAFAKSMIQKSGRFYKQAMEKMQSVSIREGSSSAATKEAETREAIRCLTQAIALVPDDLRLLILRAKANRSIGELEASLTDVDNAAFAYCQSMLGSAVPKYVPNKRMWLETQSLKPNYREPFILTSQRSLTLNEMAMRHMNTGDYNKAVGLLNRVVEEECNMNGKDMSKVDAKYFINRGDCYRATGHIEQAMSDFHRAYDSDPNNWQTKTRLSMIHYMAGLQLFNESLYSQADLEFTMAIKYNNKVSQYYASRGKACFYQNDYDRAYQDYKEALKLDPNNQDILMRIQQFDPSGSVIEEIRRNAESSQGTGLAGARTLGKGKVSISGQFDSSTSKQHNPNTDHRTLRSSTAPQFSAAGGQRTTMTKTSSPFLPNLTACTSVNPRLKNAVIIKDIVNSKRDTMKNTLSVNERREQHPLKKDALWSVMVIKRKPHMSLQQKYSGKKK